MDVPWVVWLILALVIALIAAVIILFIIKPSKNSVKSDRGPQGWQGDLGRQGPGQGATGAQGNVGPLGPAGDRGFQGASGAGQPTLAVEQTLGFSNPINIGFPAGDTALYKGLMTTIGSNVTFDFARVLIIQRTLGMTEIRFTITMPTGVVLTSDPMLAFSGAVITNGIPGVPTSPWYLTSVTSPTTTTMVIQYNSMAGGIENRDQPLTAFFRVCAKIVV